MIQGTETFEIKTEHLELLKRAYVSWWDCEYGAPAIDCKRPYGNRDVEYDIAKILGWKYDKEGGLTEEQSKKSPNYPRRNKDCFTDSTCNSKV